MNDERFLTVREWGNKFCIYDRDLNIRRSIDEGEDKAREITDKLNTSDEFDLTTRSNVISVIDMLRRSNENGER